MKGGGGDKGPRAGPARRPVAARRRRPAGHGSRLRSAACFAAFLPDGKRVVTVSPDRTIRVWELPLRQRNQADHPPAQMVQFRQGLPSFDRSGEVLP